MKKELQIRPNFKLPDTLHDRFKKACVLKNVTMQDVVLTLIKKWVEKNGQRIR